MKACGGLQNPGQGGERLGLPGLWDEFVKSVTKQQAICRLVILLARERCHTYPQGPGQKGPHPGPDFGSY